VTGLGLSADEVLTTTRSVRKRLDLDRPVAPELIRECLEIALQAPSGSNSQGWEFLVVTDAGQRRALGELYRKGVEGYLASPHAAGKQHLDDPERGPVQRRVGDSVAYLGDHLVEVPVHVIPCVHADELPEGNQAGLWGSILPAAWSFMLAARERGLGTAWTTLHLVHEQEANEILGLPADVRQAVLIPVAHTVGTGFRPAHRRPLDEVLHFDRW
jgi:nitroreductase